ncbi:helix-turn-helix transcriptional regulator [Streptomyces sp. NPDC050617]|uniref:helix-turn-helix domain-containing protein n=1 Tax=Streptomyces sp. NPDC050617 TaxID=3154628 RepID=UPI003428D0D5
MASLPQYARCAFCGTRFPQRAGPGRRKTYCGPRCRRLAQRARDGHRVSPPSAPQLWGRGIAEDFQLLATRLVSAESEPRASLRALLKLADQLENELACYRAAAVHDARVGGSAWEDIAPAAGVSAQTARARWGEARARRLLARRAREREPLPPGGHRRPAPSAGGGAAGSPGGTPVPVLPPRALGSALSHLQRVSGISVSDAARQAGLSPSYVSRVLAGERVPAWPVVRLLATALDGRAPELRILWESAQGVRRQSRQSVTAAAAALHTALRGLHLAAACPSVEELCAGTDLAPDVVRDMLAGEHVPDWPVIACLVSRLGAAPAGIRPLWEDMHYAALAACLEFPPQGLPPAGESGGTPPPSDL